MTKYYINITAQVDVKLTVEAENKEQALEKFLDRKEVMIHNSQSDPYYDGDDIEEDEIKEN